MKIDKEKLAELAAMPDDKLWSTVREIAAAHGFTLPTQPPEHSELEKMRAAVLGGNTPAVGEAIKLINDYRRRAKK